MSSQCILQAIWNLFDYWILNKFQRDKNFVDIVLRRMVICKQWRTLLEEGTFDIFAFSGLLSSKIKFFYLLFLIVSVRVFLFRREGVFESFLLLHLRMKHRWIRYFFYFTLVFYWSFSLLECKLRKTFLYTRLYC